MRTNALISTIALCTLAACSAPEAPSASARLNDLTLEVPGAALTFEEATPPAWEEIDATLEEHRISAPTLLASFMPTPGSYSGKTSWKQDGCGLDASAGTMYNKRVAHVRQQSGKVLYDIELVNPGDPSDWFLWTTCELGGLGGRAFRCDIPDQVLDLQPVFDAVVTIETAEIGRWTNKTTYVGLNHTNVTCVGADCDDPPVNNMFGSMTGPIPCDVWSLSTNKLVP